MTPGPGARHDRPHPSHDVLARTIERARRAKEKGQAPDALLKHCFVNSLAGLIQEVLGQKALSRQSKHAESSNKHALSLGRLESGDPFFKAQVLRHGATSVSDYVRLEQSHARDRQSIIKAINAVAHPGKQKQRAPGWRRHAMSRLYGAAQTCSNELVHVIHSVLKDPEIHKHPDLQRQLCRVLDGQELARLIRFQTLKQDVYVREYVKLRNMQGPPSGSEQARSQGLASKHRGRSLESRAAATYGHIATRLNVGRPPGQQYRVATSLLVPAALASGISHAKTEWDVALLQASCIQNSWDIRLLVEVKPSMDAAINDFPGLLRGLDILSNADATAVYVVRTQEGDIDIRGASLSGLSRDSAVLKKTIRYFCDTPFVLPDNPILNRANRMRLLTRPTCLEFAYQLMQGRQPDPVFLEHVWHELLESPGLWPVLHHYPIMCLVKELSMSPADLICQEMD